MQNISFTSRITPVTLPEFKNIQNTLYKRSVNFPWTHNLTVKDKAVFTNGIQDCCAGGITDGQNVVLFHLSPDRNENADFAQVKKTLEALIDFNNKELCGILVGSKCYFRKSKKLFKNLENFMKEYNIPYSSFKNKISGSTDIMYLAENDKWYITNQYIDRAIIKNTNNPEIIMKKSFREVMLSDKDTLTFDKSI